METKANRIAPVSPCIAESGQQDFLVGSRLDHILFDSLVQAPVQSARQLLTLQKTLLDGRVGLYTCQNFREAQRHYLESLTGDATAEQFLIHEMMPAFQQDFLFQCIQQAHNFKSPSAFAVFTSVTFLPALHKALPWLAKDSVEISSSPAPLPFPLDPVAPTILESTVSCICLRVGAGDRLLLTDHETAAVIPVESAPLPQLTERLLRHVVNIQGEKLAPYLSLMFDVPEAWKSTAELSTKCLLIFRQGHCPTGCTGHGIPAQITWSHLLGLVY